MSDHDREVRAARNQALFRAVNERIRSLNDALTPLTDTFAISCECADSLCVDILQISPRDYAAIRANPRQFAVLPGHVYPDIEAVVAEADEWVVVEKQGAAAEVVELLDRAGQD